jgi:hypothetical protein
VVASALSPDGRLEVFTRDGQGGLVHRWQTAANGPWSDWQWMGVFIDGAPAVASSADGRLELWATDRAGGLIHSWQTAVNGTWSTWQWTGAFTQGTPSATVSPDRRLELFARDSNGGVIHSWQTSPSGAWTRWYWTGAMSTTRPVVALNASGAIELFADDEHGGLIHTWQTGPGAAFTPQWQWMGFYANSAPTVARDADGRLHLFTDDSGGSLVHVHQITPNGIWTLPDFPTVPPQPDLRMPLESEGSPAVDLGANGLLELFVVTWSGPVVHLVQAVGGQDDLDMWTLTRVGPSFTVLGPVDAPAWADQRRELYGCDYHAGLIEAHQTAAESSFQPWQWTGLFLTAFPSRSAPWSPGEVCYQPIVPAT